MAKRSTLPCSVDGCDRIARRNGYCNMHDQRVKRYGEPGQPGPKRAPQSYMVEIAVAGTPRCSVDGCPRAVFNHTRELCQMHYRRLREKGDVGAAESLRNPHRGCSVAECGERHHSRGYCERHYKLWHVHGSPTPDGLISRAHCVKVLHGTCDLCGKIKPADEFRFSPDTDTGLKLRCIKCDTYVSRWRLTYGLTPQRVLDAYAAQDGCCAICGEHKPLIGRSADALVVDHDHATGEFRGLLCGLCNSFIGLAKDDCGRLAKAIEYLGGT